MTLTKIEAEIEIPEGFEFDRIDTKTKEGDYGFGEYPLCCHNIDYSDPRIILRKKSRPAYRVYKDKGIPGTYTQDRDSNGNVTHICGEDNVEFISDWIEYDLPKKWPTPLVERIAAIDIKAAQWIVGHWDHLLEEKYTKGPTLTFSRDAGKLQLMFNWRVSDQSWYYWYKISGKLGEQ